MAKIDASRAPSKRFVASVVGYNSSFSWITSQFSKRRVSFEAGMEMLFRISIPILVVLFLGVLAAIRSGDLLEDRKKTEDAVSAAVVM
ncbi:MAG: hypothetical protein ACRCT6_05265, partial [Notoacmeibacter sp.]